MGNDGWSNAQVWGPRNHGSMSSIVFVVSGRNLNEFVSEQHSMGFKVPTSTEPKAPQCGPKVGPNLADTRLIHATRWGHIRCQKTIRKYSR